MVLDCGNVSLANAPVNCQPEIRDCKLVILDFLKLQELSTQLQHSFYMPRSRLVVCRFLLLKPTGNHYDRLRHLHVLRSGVIKQHRTQT